MPTPTQTNYYIIDGNSYLYRAFFAIPKFSTKDGFVTNAIYGFVKMLLRLMADKHCHEIIVVFDHKGGSFRQEEFVEYKAHREKMPDELIPQIPFIQKFVELLGLPLLVIEGVEADDTIATITRQLQSDDQKHTYIITGDKDMMQLVQHNVFIYDTMKNVIYNREGVKQKMGVYPEQIPDLLGLMGDSADNIPGVPGVGPKTATDLLSKYATIEEVLAHAEEQKGALKTKLESHKDLAHLSKQLATVKSDVDISHIDLRMKTPQMQEIIALARELEFHSLMRELETLAKTSHEEIPQNAQEFSVMEHKRIGTEEELKIYIPQIQECPTLGLTFDQETKTLALLTEKMVLLIALEHEVLREEVRLLLGALLPEKKILCSSSKELFHYLGKQTMSSPLKKQLTLF